MACAGRIFAQLLPAWATTRVYPKPLVLGGPELFDEVVCILLPVSPEGKGLIQIHPGHEVKELPEVIGHLIIELH